LLIKVYISACHTVGAPCAVCQSTFCPLFS